MLSLFIIVYKSKEKAVNSILFHEEKAARIQIGKSTGQQPALQTNIFAWQARPSVTH
jgi:hypothetical protein